MAIEAAKAINAYAQAAKRTITEEGGAEVSASAGAGGDFGQMVRAAVDGAVETAKTGEAMAAAGAAGEAPLVDVVTAISAAEVTVQSVVAVRDKVIGAYQDIMRMPI